MTANIHTQSALIPCQQLQKGFNMKQKCKKHPSMTQLMFFLVKMAAILDLCQL